jgi:hypothetical protein
MDRGHLVAPKSHIPALQEKHLGCPPRLLDPTGVVSLVMFDGHDSSGRPRSRHRAPGNCV